MKSDDFLSILGELPRSWRRCRLKHVLLDIVAGGTPDSSNERLWGSELDGVPWVAIADLTAAPRISRTSKHVSRLGVSSKNLRILPKGTLLYSIYASLGKVAVLDIPATTNQAIVGLVPRQRDIEQRFLLNWLEMIQPHLSIVASSNTQANLNAEKVGNLPLCFPPLREQRQIADVLDRRTHVIDDLILKKERLLELLEERRHVLVTQAVTKGIDAEQPMKDSGVEWIGCIPTSWRAVRIRHVARLESGHTPSRKVAAYWNPEECKIPWFSLADVWQIRDAQRDYLEETAERISPIGMANSAARLLPAGTVLLSRTASVGFSGIMRVSMATTQDFANWIPGKHLMPEYLLQSLRAMKPEFERLRIGSTHKTIYMPDIKELWMALPPLSEQRRIVKHIAERLAQTDKAKGIIVASLERLREYRRSLIVAAMTGRLDVASSEVA